MGLKYILTIDVGTQSTRGIIFDNQGQIIEKEKREYNPYFSNVPGYAEQEGDFYWHTICDVCQVLKQKQPKIFEDLLGVTLTTMRNTVVPVDENGEPLRPVILWLDQRMAKAHDKIPFMYASVLKLIGEEKKIQNFRRVFRWQWIKENEKNVYKNTYKYLLLSAYLNFKLTGHFIDSTASQIGYVPYDFKRRKWASKYDVKSIAFNIDHKKMPKLVEPGEEIGLISSKASCETGIQAGIPVIASGSDKGCETLGTGCLDSETGNLSLGSAVTIQTTTPKYIEIHRFIPAYPSVIPNQYNPEIQINRGYWMVRWFKNEFAEIEKKQSEEQDIPVEVLLDKLLEMVPAGSDGLFLQPYWGGELKDPYAKGAVIGFTDSHTRAHIYRAIVEGINYAVLDGIESIERKTQRRINAIAISGGGSQSDNICKITADMMGRTVYRVQTYETSGLGAAVAAFKALNVFDTYEEAVNGMVHKESVFEPNPENAKKYKQMYQQAYKKIYPNLKKLYKEIDHITSGNK